MTPNPPTPPAADAPLISEASRLAYDLRGRISRQAENEGWTLTATRCREAAAELERLDRELQQCRAQAAQAPETPAVGGSDDGR